MLISILLQHPPLDALPHFHSHTDTPSCIILCTCMSYSRVIGIYSYCSNLAVKLNVDSKFNNSLTLYESLNTYLLIQWKQLERVFVTLQDRSFGIQTGVWAEQWLFSPLQGRDFYLHHIQTSCYTVQFSICCRNVASTHPPEFRICVLNVDSGAPVCKICTEKYQEV